MAQQCQACGGLGTTKKGQKCSISDGGGFRHSGYAPERPARRPGPYEMVTVHDGMTCPNCGAPAIKHGHESVKCANCDYYVTAEGMKRLRTNVERERFIGTSRLFEDERLAEFRRNQRRCPRCHSSSIETFSVGQTYSDHGGPSETIHYVKCRDCGFKTEVRRS